MRAKFVNEELLGTYGAASYTGAGTIEMYKNPPSIKRMGPWARALTDQDGNFYIASVEGEGKDTIATMHTVMIEWLNDNGEKVKTKWDGKHNPPMYINGICWQRYANTNKFYLSESYDIVQSGSRVKALVLEYVDNFMKEVNIYTPKSVEWVLEDIDTTEDHPIGIPGYVPEL